MADYDRLIPLKGAHNVRDLGGYPMAGGGSTRWRSIFRGDALHRLDASDIETLLGQGLSAVVDLRSDREVLLHVNPFSRHERVAYIATCNCSRPWLRPR